MQVTVIHGSFFGTERMYSNVVAVAPKQVTPEQILQVGLQREAIDRIPSRYTTQVHPLTMFHSENFRDNVVLLVIP